MRRICPLCGEREVSSSHSRCQPCNTKAVREWRNKNRERHKQNQQDYNRRKKAEVTERYGGECACCGEHRMEFLCLHHKLNNGNEERKRYHYASVWRIAIKRGFPDDYEVLCYNCNNAKEVYGACPHQETMVTFCRGSVPACE